MLLSAYRPRAPARVGSGFIIMEVPRFSDRQLERNTVLVRHTFTARFVRGSGVVGMEAICVPTVTALFSS